LAQSDAFGIHALGREPVDAVHERVGAVDVPPPAVERARDLSAGRASHAVAQLRPAVRADVVERLDGVVTLPDHDDRLAADLVLHPVARSRDLLQAARHLPDPGPQVLLLEFVELAVVVPLTRDVQRARHRERHLLARARSAILDDAHAVSLLPRSW